MTEHGELVSVCGRRMFGRGQQSVIHVDNEELVEDVREQLRNDAQTLNDEDVLSNSSRPQRQHQDLTCPVCLNEAQYPVETNCGHIYCGNCYLWVIYSAGSYYN